MEDACFNKHGYPDWFKEYKNKKAQPGVVLVAKSSVTTEPKQKNSESNLVQFSQMIQAEIKKFMQGKNTTEESPVNASYFADFAGTAEVTDFLRLENDLLNNQIVAEGVLEKNLFVLNKNSGCTANSFALANVEKKKGDCSSEKLCILSTAGLTNKFWGEAMLTAVYIINKIPTKLLNWKCPYEVLIGKIPDYSLVSTFGCLAYAANTHPHKNEFDERARKCLMVGYASNCKGYKLFDVENEEIFLPCILMRMMMSVEIPVVSNTASPSPAQPEVSLRRSNRDRKPPVWMHHYVNGIFPSSSAHNP
ncbi:Integrase, catalytic core [Senna tora]|uniref:Integrase, catalytic core n=1 Tax=Senna tora TaxID=362788 RepID=A0A834T3Y5_9FABA|nr:Integrase, catalytic core [Senna tora]